MARPRSSTALTSSGRKPPSPVRRTPESVTVSSRSSSHGPDTSSAAVAGPPPVTRTAGTAGAVGTVLVVVPVVLPALVVVLAIGVVGVSWVASRTSSRPVVVVGS
jgi:hypothetical protein